MRFFTFAACITLAIVLGTKPALAQEEAAPEKGVPEVTVRGFVRDALTGQALVGANVALRQGQVTLRGVATDADGFYQLDPVSPGRYVLRASFVGYAPYADTLRLGGERLVTLNVDLEPAPQSLDEVTVAAEGGAATVEAGRQRIRPEDLERVPTPGPGGDLAMYLQSLTGVAVTGDRGGQFFIRGGTPSQNLVLFDGTPIYQPFHILSFFSAFPQDIISEVDFYAGGFPARYTGRISSVIDVSTRAGNNRRYGGSVSAGPFLTGFSVEGPLRGGTASVLASVRNSVIERSAPVVAGQDLPLKFGDQFVKLQSFRSNGTCALSGLHTYDRGRIDNERADVVRWTNYVIAGRCLAFAPGSPTTVEVTSGYSYHKNTVGSTDDEVGVFDDERSSSTYRLHTGLDLRHQAENVQITGGLDVRADGLDYEVGELFRGVSVAEDDFLISFYGHVGTRWTPGDYFMVYPSVSLSHYARTSTSLEPRLRAYWRPWGTEAHQLSAAAGLYRQSVVGLNDERDAGAIFTAWTFAPDGSQPGATHALLGWRSDLGAGLDVSVEGYYKAMRDLRVPIWESNARFTTTLGPARGTSYGAEARLEYRPAPLYFYLGYGYAWTRYELEQENFSTFFENPVQAYHPPHDRRHQLNAVSSVDLGAWRASLRWQYGSGQPYTTPLGFDAFFDLRTLPDVRRQPGQARFLFEEAFGGRLPAYHRLDVSMERVFEVPFASVTVEAGALNLYDRSNLFYFDLYTLRRVDQLPFVPYLSVELSTR